MDDSIDNQCKELDTVIKTRRSVRVFKDKIPSRESIEEY